ncbi:hypothetical protein BCR43DRAFT_497656 [Syncephalastrum racemosum]|uniref:N-acetyltransferase domain-containing protein n=1 Tax=Syncephalastrum racemosum TaxID=13706 RepID=A0A1X2H2P7_SYNRA|nr:hypothetical protein BCR43DRAFT_497656 [Syncephalastrum racemosum]
MADASTENNTSNGNSNTSTTNEQDLKLVLRTYRPTDRDHVDFLFYSTYFVLVPEGVKHKLRSPVAWAAWIAMEAYLMGIVPVLVSDMNVPDWTGTALRVFLTLAWIVVGFAALFVLTDRFETVNRIESARQNDLVDPEVSYLNYVKYERVVEEDQEEEDQDAKEPSDEDASKKKKKKRVTFDKDAKPATEMVREKVPNPSPSHLWVLEANGQPCGMVALACWRENQPDNRKQGRTFAVAHAPHTATLQRLAVKYEYQNCGLSNILISRALSWANEHDIHTVSAVTNECQSAAAHVLEHKHGFRRAKKVRTGWLGQYDIHWECDIKQWAETHDDGTGNQTKKE